MFENFKLLAKLHFLIVRSSKMFAKKIKNLYTYYGKRCFLKKGEIMISNLNDKFRRNAYLTAVNGQDRSRPTGVIAVGRRSNGGEPERKIFSGKEAQDAARKELNISVKTDKRAIINNNIANVKYYDDWRSRINGDVLNEPIDSKNLTVAEDSYVKNSLEREDGGNPRFDSIDSEPGISGSSATETNQWVRPQRRDSRDYFNKRLPADTIESEDESADNNRDSLFDKLFKRAQDRIAAGIDNKSKSQEKFSIESSSDDNDSLDYDLGYDAINDVDEDIDEIDDVSEAQPIAEARRPQPVASPARLSAKKSTTRKRTYNKRKKLDADIIGSAGFFTIE